MIKKIFLYLVVTLIVLLPTPALALQAVKGELPEEVPLQTPDDGVVPNYSHNIQSGKAADLNTNQAEVSTDPVDEAAVATTPVSKSHAVIWIVIIVVLIGLVLYGVNFWRKKVRGVEVPVFLLACALATAGFLNFAHSTHAQSLPKGAQPVSRTIVSEDDPITQTPADTKPATNYKALYGIGAIILILVAVGGVWMLWTRKEK